MRRFALALFTCLPLWLTGCDMLGIESASAIAARKDAEGRAVGGGCRYSGRSIEDCYAQNRRSEKAAVFAGWREMNDYMRENKIDTVRAPGSTEMAAQPDDGAAPAKRGAAEHKSS